MSRRRQSESIDASVHPQYEWALASDGRPVHISEADRGAVYICPVCERRMVAKLGAIKQHHFAHDTEQMCSPAEVARVAARRWLVEALQGMVRQRQGVILTWPCPLCEDTHTADLLHDIMAVAEQHPLAEGLTIDVALLDPRGAVSRAIALALPGQNVLRRAAENEVMVLVVDASERRLTPDGGLEAFLERARVFGGVCATRRSAAAAGVVTDEASLRRLLIDAVKAPPHYIYGSLGSSGGLTHVFQLKEKRLWLPPNLWQRAIGGLRHTINPTLRVLSQEWPQPDGATIALYYVTSRGQAAIAVRRFPPGQSAYARLDPNAMQGSRLSALAVARGFAEV